MSALTLVGGNTQIPTHIAARGVSAATLALAGSDAAGKRISIEGGTFRMYVDGQEMMRIKDRDLDIIIVRASPANSRSYYDPTVAYKRGASTPPLCISVHGDKPDANSKEPQHSTCMGCPNNAKGSGNNGSRACRFHRKLAVVLANDIMGNVYQLNIPATSLFGDGVDGRLLPLEAYNKMLKANNVNIDDFVTKIEFDTDAATPKLTFSAVRFLDQEEVNLVNTQAETADAKQATGDDKNANTPKKISMVALPTSEKTEVPEPTTKAKPVTPRNQENIKKTIDAWGDDE